MSETWDVIVIGAGPAGLRASAVAAKSGARVMCIDKLGPGGLMMNLGEIHVAPAEAGGMTGPDFIAALLDQASDAGVEMGFGEVTALKSGTTWSVVADDAHTTRAVIVASGLSHGTLGLPEEERYLGQGISHCAACDGPLYAGQPVVVVGGEGWAVQEARELAGVASAVTVIAETAPSLPNLTVVPDRIIALDGDDGLQGLVIERGGQTMRLETRALFPYIGRKPACGFADANRDATGALVVGADGATSAPGLFAAGDVRAGAPETIAQALADAEKAGAAAAGWAATHR
jgi:thioredoxin reductase (NADPH)